VTREREAEAIGKKRGSYVSTYTESLDFKLIGFSEGFGTASEPLRSRTSCYACRVVLVLVSDDDNWGRKRNDAIMAGERCSWKGTRVHRHRTIGDSE